MIQRYLSTLVVFLFIANSAAAQLTNTYCSSGSAGGVNDLSDIGGFSFGAFVNTTGGQHLSNPTATKTYTDYTAKDIIAYVDSAYYIEVFHTLKDGTQVDAKVTLFIDFNNNGVFEPGDLVWTTNTNSNNIYVHTTLNVPAGTITQGAWLGMRVILNNYLAPSAASDTGCGSYVSGETEDYKIKFLQKFKLDVPAAAALKQLKVFPNPSAGIYNIDLEGYAGVVSLTVQNLLGQTVYSQANVSGAAPFTLSLDQQPAGIYQLVVKAGDQLINHKLVKQ